MPMPPAGYSAATKLACNTASANTLIAQLDSHATLPAYIALYDAADVELVRQNFSDPSGTVDPATGNTTLTPTGTQTAVVAGTPAYSVYKDGADTIRIALPVETGTAPVVGKTVISASPLLAGTPVTFQNITITWP